METARLLAMLRSAAGATIDAMAKETGWQPHSVRGFLAGTVRKHLKLLLVSKDGKTGRVYRVWEKSSRATKGSKAAKAA